MTVALLSPPRDRVPAEFIGLARAFRGRVADADVGVIDVIRATSRQLVERMGRHPVPRAETLAGIVRAWRTTAPFARISLSSTFERKTLAIVETRVASHSYHDADWQQDALEPGISVVRISLAIAPRTRPALSFATLCAVSLHALGRRFERGHPIDDDAIIADIAALAAPLDVEDGPIAVPVPDGRWLGSMVEVRKRSGATERIASARTFVT